MPFHFTYPGFHWVKPLPGQGMSWLFLGLAALALLVAIGFFYRIAISLFTIGFSYTFLIDRTTKITST